MLNKADPDKHCVLTARGWEREKGLCSSRQSNFHCAKLHSSLKEKVINICADLRVIRKTIRGFPDGMWTEQPTCQALHHRRAVEQRPGLVLAGQGSEVPLRTYPRVLALWAFGVHISHVWVSGDQWCNLSRTCPEVLCELPPFVSLCAKFRTQVSCGCWGFAAVLYLEHGRQTKWAQTSMRTLDVKTHCSYIFPRQDVEELMSENCRRGIQQSFRALQRHYEEFKDSLSAGSCWQLTIW